MQTRPQQVRYAISLSGDTVMIELETDRFRLTIPVGDAMAFAMGWSDLGYDEANDGMRRIIGALAVDTMEYNEQWRDAAVARACLNEKWPGCFSY
jgi:hypothetical protein